jgi:predicted nucleic acid-binding protein
MKIFIDTNVIVDVMQKRDAFYRDSFSALEALSQNGEEGLLSAKSLTDIYYLGHRLTHDKKAAGAYVGTLLDLYSIVDTTSYDIHRGLSLPMADFEDSVLAASAERAGADFILTRNVGDFASSPVKAISPKEFLTIEKQNL